MELACRCGAPAAGWNASPGGPCRILRFTSLPQKHPEVPLQRRAVIATSNGAAFSPSTILIAEDHPDSAEALRTLLEAFGYQVLVARNGREAVETALEHHPELVLMDVMMPEVDGLEATRRLRAAPGFPQVPILALTAMEGAARLSVDAGCDQCIAKPINIRAFLTTVQEWLERGRRS